MRAGLAKLDLLVRIMPSKVVIGSRATSDGVARRLRGNLEELRLFLD
jgi:hypothetical protein